MKIGRIVSFGEILLRLSPPRRELLLQSPALDSWIGGAEANVATALAVLGHDVSLVSALPEGPLGNAAITYLRGHGVDVSTIIRMAGRMGLYYVTPGAGVRATEVHYDRAGSVFVRAAVDGWDWPALLAGADQLHLSGITPALGQAAGHAAFVAVETAAAMGIRISFDGNYRARLWDSWDGKPRETLRRLVGYANILFGNRRDIALLLGADFVGTLTPRAAAEAAFEAFPQLELIASTERHADQVDQHRLSARIDDRSGSVETGVMTVPAIVDRIGAGDAFAAGVLHGLRTGLSLEEAARTGLILSALKHSLPGDASLFVQADIDAYSASSLDVRR